MDSIYKYIEDIKYEIIVSDNGSTEVLKSELWKSVYMNEICSISSMI